MNLEQMIPERVSFRLKSTGKEYFLRPFNLEDEAWMVRKFTKEELAEAFNPQSLESVFLMLYHQLEKEGKAEFQAVKVDDFDDDGVPVSFMKTGPQRLREAAQGGMVEYYQMFESLLKCRGLSLPEFNEALKEAAELEENKKKIIDQAEAEGVIGV